MGNENHNQNIEDFNSTSSVLNFPLESIKGQHSDSNKSDTNSDDIINDLKKEVSLPIENECIESSEIILEGKEEQNKIKYLLDNEDTNIDSLFRKKRSKTFAPKRSLKNTPRPHPMESYEYISPLKLSIKSFGNIPEWNRKPNAVLYDFQKNIIDCKSCNDDEGDNFDDLFLLNAETERSTPNVEDLQNLLDCRKKMTIFRNSLNERTLREYENILDSDYIFDESRGSINSNNHHQKKNNFWFRHIKQQQLRNKNKLSTFHNRRFLSESIVKIYDSAKEEEEDEKENGLFILGILESAANERKKKKLC